MTEKNEFDEALNAVYLMRSAADSLKVAYYMQSHSVVSAKFHFISGMNEFKNAAKVLGFDLVERKESGE